MSGISLRTCLEIFAHPHDLCVRVAEDGESKKWCVVIMRGPGHGYKLLISTPANCATRQAAVESVTKALAAVVELATKELADPRSIAREAINPGGKPIEELDVLTQPRIDAIVRQLRDRDIVRTGPEAAPVRRFDDVAQVVEAIHNAQGR